MDADLVASEDTIVTFVLISDIQVASFLRIFLVSF